MAAVTVVRLWDARPVGVPVEVRFRLAGNIPRDVMTGLLLLDLDDTVADREGAFLAWARTKVEEWAPNDHGGIAYLNEHDDDGMRPRHAFFAAVRERFGLQHPVEALTADYRRELCAALPAVPDDIIEQLHALRAAGWKLAVVTNGAADVQAQKIDHLGVLPLLDACCISAELGIRKPDPRIFEIAAARCDRPLDSAWMIGDGEADIVGAHRAGIRSVWLHRDRTWPRLDLRPDHIADGLSAALVLLDRAL